MRTKLKITRIKAHFARKNHSQIAKTEPVSSEKSLKRVIFGVFWGQKRWILSIAVILFVFAALDGFGVPPTKDISEKPQLFKEETTQIAAETIEQQAGQQKLNQAESGVLGGPTTLGALIAPIALADVDFAADDGLEDQDILLIQENSIVSANNPSGTNSFSGFTREISTYIVKQGDVPERIAASFNINSDTLLWANGLRDGDIIKPGQELIVLPINGVRVKVGAKDTIASLAKKHNGDPMEIIAFNNLPLEGTVKAGEYIIIPDGEIPAPAQPRYTTPSKKYAETTTQASSWLIWPTSGRNWGRIHASNGVDIANVCGTPVYAAAAGKVILSDGVGYNGGYGKYIKIQNSNGVTTLYAHATKLLVSEGEKVEQGQLILLMGTTGRSTGCHLHFEVRGATNPLATRKK